MRVFNRGQQIVFRHSFYDSSGDLSSPNSANLILSYPDSGWPHRGFSNSTTLPMVESTVGSTHPDFLVWTCTWGSVASYPGPVYWSIRASDLTLSVADGELMLRGNPANMTVTSTT